MSQLRHRQCRQLYKWCRRHCELYMSSSCYCSHISIAIIIIISSSSSSYTTETTTSDLCCDRRRFISVQPASQSRYMAEIALVQQPARKRFSLFCACAMEPSQKCSINFRPKVDVAFYRPTHARRK